LDTDSEPDKSSRYVISRLGQLSLPSLRGR